MSPRAAALFVFERVSETLRAKGIDRHANATELELADRARVELSRPEVVEFLRAFYLPVIYGYGPSITAEEAAALLEPLCGRIELPKTPLPSEDELAVATGSGSSRRGAVADSTGEPPASEDDADEDGAPSGAPAPAACARCGKPVGAGA